MSRTISRGLPAVAALALVVASLAWPLSAQAVVSPTVSSYTVPAGVTAVSITVKGAAGAAPSGSSGGAGGVVTSVITVTPGQVLQLSEGAMGGGGAPGANNLNGPAGAGGGASDVRVGACAATLSCALSDRVIVAGGGGGAGGGGSITQCGGAGGANSDGSGSNGCERSGGGPDWPHGGGGASPVGVGAGGLPSNSSWYHGNPGAAGSGIAGGNGGNGTNSAGGGGGEGYFGGGGGAGVDYATDGIPGAGGGGGSSWASPSTLSTDFLPSTNGGNGVITVTPVAATWTSAIALALSAPSEQATIPVTFTATVSPAGTGTVTFYSNTAAIAGCVNVSLSSSIATCTTTYATVGARTIVATYWGSDLLLPSTSSSQTQTITKKLTASAVSSATNPTNVGSPVTYSAQVIPLPTGGTFAFTSGGSSIASCSSVAIDGTGTATCTLTYTATGDRSIAAVYSGNTDYATSTSSALTEGVIGAATATTLVSDANPTGIGGGVTYTATVSPPPAAGTMEFTDGASAISGCTVVTVNTATGIATCSVTYATTGTHPIVASFSGSADYAPSVSPTVTQTVVAGSSNHAVGTHLYTVPAGVTALTITVRGAAGAAPSGSSGGAGGVVTSTVDVTPGQILQLNSGTVGGGGAAGANNLNGPPGAGGGASDVRVGACAATLSCALSDRIIVAGGGGGAGGGGSILQCGGAGGANSDGSGNNGCERSGGGPDWPHGGHGASATGVGAGGLPSNSSWYHGNAGAAGSGSSGGAGGNGNNSAGGGGGAGYFGGGGGAGVDYATDGIPGAGGGGGSSWAYAAALSTVFVGASNSGNGTITVTPLATSTHSTTALVLSPTTEQATISVTFTATVSPSATGTVTFTSNTAPIAGCVDVTITASVASCTTTYATVGARNIVATYSGSATLLPSASSTHVETITQKTTTTAIASSIANVAATQNVTYTATVTPTPTSGSVTFSRDGSPIPACTNVVLNLFTSTATCTESYITSGNRSIVADYSGNGDYAPSGSSTLTQVVSGTATTSTISSPVNPSAVGQSITLTAVVSPAPNAGTVAFSDNGSVVCAAAAVNTSTGKAVCQVKYLTTGSHTISAVYSGATDYGMSSTALLTQNVTSVAATTAGGGVESFTVPAGWTSITITTRGASGTAPSGSSPGPGGTVTSVMTVTPGQVIQLNTGVAGGGGAAGANNLNGPPGAGGGASDVRVGACAATLSCALSDRIIVAGGGGGAGGGGSILQCGGAGGANSDGSGNNGCERSGGGPDWPHGGHGASATGVGAGGLPSNSSWYHGNAGAAGSGSSGGAGGNGNNSAGGGGGAGYFGGGGGAGVDYATDGIPGAGGGGGSSWASPSLVSSSFNGASTYGDGSISISRTATQLSLTQAVSSSLPYGQTRVLTATIKDAAGNLIDSGAYSTSSVTFAITSGTGAVTGLGSPAAVNGVATLTVTGSVVGTLGITATAAAITSNELALTVIGAAQTITFAQPTTPHVYGTTFSATGTSTSALAVSIAASGGCSIAGSTVTMTSGTTDCTLTASQTGNASYSAAVDVVRTVAASKATQASVAATGPSTGTYGSSYTITAGGGSGTGAYSFAQSGPCTLSDETATTVSATITAGSGTCVVTATRAADANYLVASGTRSITALKAVLAVNAHLTSKVYGFTDQIFTATLTGFAFSDSETSVFMIGAATCSRASGELVGAYALTCTPGSLTAANYSFATGASSTFAITPAVLVVAASNATISYGDSAPTISPIYYGLTNGDTLPATPATCSTLVDSTTVVGTYASTCSGVADYNYTVSYTAGTVAVLIANQTITFAQPTTPATFGSSFTVAPTSNSGLAVTLVASGGCTAVGYLVTVTSGTTDCTLEASQAGSSNFTAATPVSRTVSAAKATQAALGLAAPASATYGDTFDVTTSGGSGTGAGTFSLAPGSVCAIDSVVGSVASVTLATGVGTCTVVFTKATDADYLTASTSISITAERALLDVDAVTADKTYGDADPAFTFDLSGFIAGDDASVTSGSADCTRTTGEDVGSYTITCAPGSLTAANYSFATALTAVMTIDARDLTITASDAATHFGDAAPTITPAFDNLAGGDTATSVAPACTTSVDASTPTGSYASTCSGAVDANYSITYVDGTVVVAAAAQTLTFVQPGPAVFGASFSVAPVASSSLAVVVTASGGCSVVAATTWQVTMTSGTDSCELLASQAGDANFAAAHLTVTVTALKAAQSTLTASGPASAVYGESFSVEASGGSGTGSLELSESGSCAADGDQFAMTAGTGSCVVVATKAGDANYSAAESTVTVDAELAMLSVDAANAEKALGDDDPHFTWTSSGFVAGDTAETVLIFGAAECAREPGDTAGDFAITCEPGTLSAANYGFETGATGVLTVSEVDTTDGDVGDSAGGEGDGTTESSGPATAAIVLIIVGGVAFAGSVGAAVYFIRRRVLF